MAQILDQVIRNLQKIQKAEIERNSDQHNINLFYWPLDEKSIESNIWCNNFSRFQLIIVSLFKILNKFRPLLQRHFQLFNFSTKPFKNSILICHYFELGTLNFNSRCLHGNGTKGNPETLRMILKVQRAFTKCQSPPYFTNNCSLRSIFQSPLKIHARDIPLSFFSWTTVVWRRLM